MLTCVQILANSRFANVIGVGIGCKSYIIIPLYVRLEIKIKIQSNFQFFNQIVHQTFIFIRRNTCRHPSICQICCHCSSNFYFPFIHRISKTEAHTHFNYKHEYLSRAIVYSELQSSYSNKEGEWGGKVKRRKKKKQEYYANIGIKLCAAEKIPNRCAFIPKIYPNDNGNIRLIRIVIRSSLCCLGKR